MKITTKTTKEQLKSFLGANAPIVQKEDKALFEQLVYADKMLETNSSKVTRKDLVDLAKSVMKALGDKCVEPTLEPLAENSVKKLTKVEVNKKQDTKKEETVHTEESKSSEGKKTEEGKDTKKSAKKPLGKKETTLKTPKATPNEKVLVMADSFPQTLTQGDDTYELITDEMSMEDLFELLTSDEEIVFAFYWTARHIKQFGYYNNQLPCPKSFPQDLDICTAIYVSEEFKVAYAISRYTEANYAVFPQDLVIDKSTGIRYCAGIEYQIYRLVQD